MMAEELFRRCTGLDGGDLAHIAEVARTIDIIAELTGADIFIDCREADTGCVFVAAHAVPRDGSLYRGPVVGQRVLPENETAVYSAFESGMPVRDIKAITQENCLVRQDAAPLFSADGSVIGVIVCERDITQSMERAKKIELLENTISRLKSTLEDLQKDSGDIVEHIGKGVVIFDDNDVAIYFNEEAARIYRALGFREPLVGATFEEASFGNRELRAIKAGVGAEAALRVGTLSLVMRGQPLSRSDMGGVFALFVDDCTEVQKKEHAIISHSRALKEVNHRVKNSLQMVASMLSIQSRRMGNREAREALQSTISRVYSVSMIYDLLTKQDFSQKLWLRELLTGVAECSKSYVLSDAFHLTLSITGDDFQVSGDSAITIGIVVHELVVNAIRHAFPGQSEGEIRVHLQKGNLYSSIVVEDNGAGCAPTAGKESFGIDLVRMMVREKLDGRLHIQSSDAGTKVMIDFENKLAP